MNYLVERATYRINLAILSSFARMYNQCVYTHVFAVSLAAMFISVSLICEIAVFFKRKFTVLVFIEVGPVMVVNIVCLIILPALYMNRKNLDLIRELYTEYAYKNYNEMEKQLKGKYEEFSHILVNLISFTEVIGAPFIFLTSLTPQFLDMILPINGTRHLTLPFPGEYFVDEQEYFYHILFFECLTTFAVTLLIGSLESMFVTTVYFVCGILAVIGYRLENILSRSGDTCDEEMMIETVRQAMTDYRNMKRCVALLNVCVDLLAPSMLVGTAIAFSMTLVQVTNIELVNPRSVAFATIQIGQFFVVNYVAEALLNTSATLLDTVYRARWYDCSIKIQRMFILILLAVRKPSAIRPRGLFVLCVETFGAVTQTAMSYFMVLRQFQ